MMRIRHPVSFCVAIALMITTALLSVALHGFMFAIAVLDVICIGLLPLLARLEYRHVSGEHIFWR